MLLISKRLKCCGVTGAEDFTGSKSFDNQFVTNEGTIGSRNLPCFAHHCRKRIQKSRFSGQTQPPSKRHDAVCKKLLTKLLKTIRKLTTSHILLWDDQADAAPKFPLTPCFTWTQIELISTTTLI
ncbi:hypothetical protein T265_05323 [Opisthorchis viverrini]|uniref:Uncharacterized protein n=1 Tax=Opisthorchis viverrini TaxID=6198 RepID=A0A074ZWI6_OPIVI|nr:hypothetical protein T265_05323 [Opisthorchis viverrini]KER27695.1 hypothetical protein T265_05323 [Opisthorchis viverrini]